MFTNQSPCTQYYNLEIISKNQLCLNSLPVSLFFRQMTYLHQAGLKILLLSQVIIEGNVEKPAMPPHCITEEIAALAGSAIDPKKCKVKSPFQ